VVALHIYQEEWFKTVVVLLSVGLSILFAKIFYDKVEMPTQQWAKSV
jgi:peptidoglycan/LPS O-acetylase OafA/YrhL